MIGKTLSQFRIVEKIGEGGMGVVYRAEDQKLGRQVALKVLHPEFVTDDERRKRFIREARTAAAVSHPHIAGIHQIDEQDGVIFIAMELVEGRTLKTLIDGRPLQSDPCLGLAVEIAEGLARAHRNGIVHRDLKPENVVVGADGHAKILDFGLAKLYDTPEGPFADDVSGVQTISAAVTREGRILGTVAYMSPEQARGLEVDARSDVFTFGIVLYEMATGKSPFEGATITDTLTAILRDEQPPVARYNPQIPAELERIMSRCLEKDPDARYQNAGEILADLRALKKLSDSQPVPLVSDSLVGLQPPRPLRKRPAVWAAAAVLALAAILVGPRLAGWFQGEAPPPLEDALAVLPFENLEDQGDPERLGQILQELIIADLSELSSPRVLSSQRLFDVQRQLGREDRSTIDRDLAGKVARRAGARTMLTGTLSRLGPSWILTTQLIDVGDGTVIKSERLDGRDLYAMVDDLTGLVRMDLGVATGVAAADLAVKDRTSASLDAYQAFLRGVDQLNALEFDPAVTSLEEAVTIDPSFGQAHYKLAIARWWSRSLSKMEEFGQSAEDPGRDLRRLLESQVKLSSKDRMLAEAFLALVESRTRDARPLFEEALRRHPDEKEAWYGLGEALFHSPDGPATRLDALEPFERAIELDPSFALAYYHLIDLYLQDKRYDEGIRQARAFIEEDPENPSWYVAWLRAVIARGDPAEIDAAVDEALTLVHDPAMQRKLLQGASMALESVDDFEKADALLVRALEIDSEESQAELLAQRGGIALYRGEAARGERFYRQALEAEPGSRKALNGLFHMLDNQRRYAEAIQLARGLAADQPSEPQHYAQWHSAAVESGDADEAAAAWDAVEARIADGTLDAAAAGQLWQARVRAHFEIQDMAAVQRHATEGIERSPAAAHPALLVHLGWSELSRGMLDEAERHFSTALEADHEMGGALMGLVQVATLREDHEAALAWARQLNVQTAGSVWGRAKLVEALLRNGEPDRADEIARRDGALWHKGREQAYYFRELAVAYLGAGMPVRAEGALRRFLGADVDSGDINALFRLGWSLMLQGEYQRAREVLDVGLARSPRNAELLYALAVNEMLTDDDAAAEARIAGLLDEGPVLASGHILHAYALARLGRHEEAESAAERAMEMFPGRASRAALAWVQVDGDIDIENGLWLAEEALVMPGEFYDAMHRMPFNAPPEHTAGLAFMKMGRYDEAVSMLEAAAAGRPDRTSIEEDLRRVRPLVSRKSP
jgi:serine/threonine protein kinase/Tfp pilus assembly protein PilF/TolB-like protein